MSIPSNAKRDWDKDPLGFIADPADIFKGPDYSRVDAQLGQNQALAAQLMKQQGADRATSAEDRAAMQGAANSLRQTAAGQTPSVAEHQGQRQAQEAAAHQYALASALQGVTPGGALQSAQTGAAQVQADVANQAMSVRAAEQARAQSELANLLTNARSQDITSAGQNVGSAAGLYGAATNTLMSEVAGNQQQKGALMGAGAQGLAAIISDEKTKRHVTERELADALGAKVHGVAFEYKPEMSADHAKHFGVMAQQIEQVIPGVVAEGADGMKRLRVDHLTAANTALLAELSRRIRKLEGR